jgi:hypothetical protein
VQQKHDQGRLDTVSKSRWRGGWFKKHGQYQVVADDDVLMGLGSFVTSDGSEHWGIELVAKAEDAGIDDMNDDKIGGGKAPAAKTRRDKSILSYLLSQQIHEFTEFIDVTNWHLAGTGLRRMASVF